MHWWEEGLAGAAPGNASIENNRIQFRPVSILRFENDDVLVSSGLQSGDIVNISPLQTVIEGMRVNPVVDELNRG